jgi:ABC-type nitrate/sulfonate/bicarbonate transport system permease component
MRRLRAFARGFDFLAGLILFLGFWYAATSVINSPVLFPTPFLVFQAGRSMLAGGTIWQDVLASLSRISVGYVCGVLGGLACGIVLGQIRLLDRWFSPIVSFVRMIPPVALVPLAIIWFGIGEQSKYFVIMWGTTIVVLFNTVDGLQNVPRTRVLAARCLGASPLRVIRDVVLPSAVPSIWTGMKLSIGGAISTVVSAELIAANRGIGFEIMRARALIEVDQMFVGLAALAVMGGIIDRVFKVTGEQVLQRYLEHVRR